MAPHRSRPWLFRHPWSAWVLLAVSLWFSILALAQSTNDSSALNLGFRGVVTLNACNFTSVGVNMETSLVVNLPALQTALLRDAPFSPIALVPLRLGLKDNDVTCQQVLMGRGSSQLVFDTALANVAPGSGLLRNSAVTLPAQNLLVQLGLIGTDGMFIPLNLNQPEALNASLQLRPQTTGVDLSLKLGVRYVAERFVSESYASLGGLSPGGSDVTPGNVSVFLPFMMSLK